MVALRWLELIVLTYLGVRWAAGIEIGNETLAEVGEKWQRRRLLNVGGNCDSGASTNGGYKEYFADIDKIYGYSSVVKGGYESTCLPVHQKCGWPKTPPSSSSRELPLFVLSVGLEGAGHHLWTELLGNIFDCSWINGRHYHRNVGDGLGRTTPAELSKGIREQLAMRTKSGKPPCKFIYDAEDSFPTGAIRRTGRCFMRPDIVNLEQLDGVLFRVKYLVIARNATDTALSSLRRNFFTHVDLGLRCVEDTFTYVEAALRGVPCHRIFVAHYEHVLAKPSSYAEPLADFLEFDDRKKSKLAKALKDKDKGKVALPQRTVHKLTQYPECVGIKGDIANCYNRITTKIDTFLSARSFMWPTFAGNGFALQ